MKQVHLAVYCTKVYENCTVSLSSASKPEEADQHSVVHAAKPSKRPTNAHAKYAARTRARAKCCTSSLAQQQPMVYGANAQDPAGEGCHTAQQPSIAASTRAVRQKGSSTSDAGDPVSVAVHSYSAHQASTIASSRAAGKNSSKAHAQDSACEAFQTACDQLPAARTKAGSHVPDPTALDPAESSHADRKEPIAARTRSAHRALTVTTSRSKRKEHATVDVDDEEQCRGAKRARAGSASTEQSAGGRSARRAASRKKTTGRPLRSKRE